MYKEKESAAIFHRRTFIAKILHLFKYAIQISSYYYIIIVIIIIIVIDIIEGRKGTKKRK